MTKMKLWLLQPVENLPDKYNPFEPWYDKASGFVIRAETEKKARKIANKNGGDELGLDRKDKPWLDPKLTSCRELIPEGKEQLILKDFRAA